MNHAVHNKLVSFIWSIADDCLRDVYVRGKYRGGGLWDEILQALVKKRLSVGKTATPTYAIIDSQSVKTTSKSDQKGFDGGKNIKGRKRHILVDTIGNLLGVVVHAANIHDTKAGIMVADKSLQIYPTIKAISADAGYRKTFSMIRNKKQKC